MGGTLKLRGRAQGSRLEVEGLQVGDGGEWEARAPIQSALRRYPNCSLRSIAVASPAGSLHEAAAPSIEFGETGRPFVRIAYESSSRLPERRSCTTRTSREWSHGT